MVSEIGKLTKDVIACGADEIGHRVRGGLALTTNQSMSNLHFWKVRVLDEKVLAKVHQGSIPNTNKLVSSDFDAGPVKIIAMSRSGLLLLMSPLKRVLVVSALTGRTIALFGEQTALWALLSGAHLDGTHNLLFSDHWIVFKTAEKKVACFQWAAKNATDTAPEELIPPCDCNLHWLGSAEDTFVVVLPNSVGAISFCSQSPPLTHNWLSASPMHIPWSSPLPDSFFGSWKQIIDELRTEQELTRALGGDESDFAECYNTLNTCIRQRLATLLHPLRRARRPTASMFCSGFLIGFQVIDDYTHVKISKSPFVANRTVGVFKATLAPSTIRLSKIGSPLKPTSFIFGTAQVFPRHLRKCVMLLIDVKKSKCKCWAFKSRSAPTRLYLNYKGAVQSDLFHVRFNELNKI